MAAGALGARMTGGGFGGSAIALVDPGDRDRVAAEVDRAFTPGRLDAAHHPRRDPVGPGDDRLSRTRAGQVAETPILPSRKASTNSAWSARTVAA